MQPILQPITNYPGDIVSNDRSALQDDFDIIAAEIADRMSEYNAAIAAFGFADPAGKVDLWNAACDKSDDIRILHGRLSDIATKLQSDSIAGPTRAATILADACRAVSWGAPAENDERVLAHWCQQQAKLIKDPVARSSALSWIQRALGYAQHERRDQAINCIRNAKVLLDR